MSKAPAKAKSGHCGFCLVDIATEFFTSNLDEKVAICNQCVCFLQSLDNQTLGRDENRHKPYADVERVAYGIFRDPKANGIAFSCSYCGRNESRLIFAAPGQDICIECIDHFNSH